MIPEPDDFSDEHWLDEHGEFVLAFHDPGCVAEAIQDAFNHGVDDEAGARCAAAQLLEGGDIPCRCAPSAP